MMLENPESTLYVSSASVWETAIKHAVKPVDIPVTAEQMIRFCRSSGIVGLPVRFRHAQRVSMLPLFHNDPFDRMLVAQAVEEGMMLMSHDCRLSPYGDFVLPI